MILALFSCGKAKDKEEKTSQDTSPTDTEQISEIERIDTDTNSLKKKAVEMLNALPDTDMSKGNGITIASASPMSFVTEEQSNAYSYAVTQRNQLFEKKYSTSVTSFSEETDIILENAYYDMLSGLEYADLLSVPAKDLNKFITKGLLLDLNALPRSDFSAEYFDQELMNNVSTPNERYAIYGAFNKDLDNYQCLYVNDTLLETAGIPSPYQSVEKGEWTWDKLLEISKTFAVANTSATVLTSSSASDLADICFKSSGYDYIISSPETIPYVSFASDSSQKVLDLLRGFNTSVKPEYSSDTAALFCEGNTLFCTGKTSDMKKIKALSADWGILPLPKADKNTESYTSLMSKEHSVICVFAGANTENVFAAIEGLNAASYGGYLTEAYYKDLINTSLPDANTLNMLDYVLGVKGIITKNCFTDIYAERIPKLTEYTRDSLSSAAAGNTVHIFMAEDEAKKQLDPILSEIFG